MNFILKVLIIMKLVQDGPPDITPTEFICLAVLIVSFTTIAILEIIHRTRTENREYSPPKILVKTIKRSELTGGYITNA